MRIAVYCSSAPNIDQVYLDLAFNVGVALAKSGADLVWGAGQVSMMGQVARGTRSQSGKTYGVIPERLTSVEFVDSECTELFVVPDMRSRKAKLEDLADAFIVLPGGIGTLEEFFEIWVGRSLGYHSKPVTVCDPYGAFVPLKESIDYLAEINMMKTGQDNLVNWCTTIESAIAACYVSTP